MKALTIHQPWAWAIAQGHKDVENRTWSTSHRGDLLIHAGKTFDDAGYLWIRNEIGLTLPARSGFRRGYLVAIVTLTDCMTECDSQWFTGPYGFVLANPFRFDPIPYRGMPGLFEVSAIQRQTGN